MRKLNISYRGVSAAAVLLLGAGRAEALERRCDPSFENCRTEVLNLIRSESVGIDVGLWFIEDNRWANALIERWRA